MLVAGAGASTFLKKKLAKVGALKTSNPQLQLAPLPENEVLPSVQINLFARLAERNITPRRVKTVYAGVLRGKNLRAWRRAEVVWLFCFASEDCASSPTVRRGRAFPHGLSLPEFLYEMRIFFVA